ncbi:MATE family efflux transporter [Vulgatibacter incomptus]|uniref:Multidrug-efflux transporter n=1 Tax=Vulgatibacter incomptus TaxID=1391653 RepID=A0A0K1PAM3_9BACT|nr:MATE family efflux transporter [Vulgatibacter incomptus]AKU90588.1 Multi antimicrobial extrusion protein (Na(+)/drug antiporter), MATE family of MDR efflux pump [Vulgatibacter incomptus]
MSVDGAIHPNPAIDWAGRPLPALTRLAWPTAISMLSYSAMTLVDTIFVGRLGPAAIAGVGFGGVASFALMCFPLGLVRSAKILVSHEAGAGRPGSSAPILGSGLVLSALLGLLLLGAAFGISPLIAGMGGGGEAGHHATTYFDIRLWFAPFVLAYNALREVRFGTGDARSPMVAALAANALNIGLNYWLIFGLQLGVSGSAWATNIACVLEGGILAWAQRGDGLRFDRMGHWLRSLARLGIPTGLQFVLEVGSFTLLAGLISSMGEVQMAAHQIAVQVLQFSFLPAIAIGEAASVMSGQAVGAGRLDLVPSVAKRAMQITLVYTLVCGAVFLLGGRSIVSGFTDDPTLASVAVHLLFLGAFFQVADGANIVARLVLRGTGDVRFAAIFGIVIAWACTPPLTWLLGHQLGMGAFGGWLGLAMEILAGACVFWLRLKRGGWRPIAEELRRKGAEPDPAPAPLAA